MATILKNKFPISILTTAIAIILFLASCSTNIPRNKVLKAEAEISQDSSFVTVKSRFYSLKINKKNALVDFFNGDGKKYASFPLSVLTNELSAQQPKDHSIKWKVIDNHILCEKFIRDTLTEQVELKFYDKSFSVKFSVQPLVSGVGVYFFRSTDKAMETDAWSEFFTPEPDDYYAQNPQIDIRTDRDQKWKFAPAPLNLSFRTPAGWFSAGLLDLPDATIFSFKENSLWLDIPWEKVIVEKDKLFPLPALVITCNNSEWDGVRDFSEFVIQKKFAGNIEAKNFAAWWKNPIVSPHGDRLLKGFSADDPRYTLDWVKSFVDSIRASWLSSDFILIIDGKWNKVFGDATPSKKFAELRQFIDWCHERGIRVVLSWKAWKIEPDSRAVLWGLHDGEFSDATHHLFPAYVDTCSKIIFGDQKGQLNADGIQIEDLFLTPNPAASDFENPALGMGIKEAYRYLAQFYRRAKFHKPDALIISSAIDPHFYHVQDMVLLQDDWDNKLRREKRARIILNSLPGKLINAGAATMYNKLAPYHFATAAIFGMPALQYSDSFADGKISAENKNFLKLAVLFAANKPEGRISFSDFGKWTITSIGGKLLAETAEKGKGIIVYRSNSKAEFLSAHNGRLVLLLDNFEIRKFRDSAGNTLSFQRLADGIFELGEVKCGEKYFLDLKKIPKFR